MRISRVFFGGFFLLFGMIGAVALLKKNNGNESQEPREEVEEISLGHQQEPLPAEEKPIPVVESVPAETEKEIDRIPLLFTLDSSKLPIVETISYTSRV